MASQLHCVSREVRRRCCVLTMWRGYVVDCAPVGECEHRVDRRPIESVAVAPVTLSSFLTDEAPFCPTGPGRVLAATSQPRRCICGVDQPPNALFAIAATRVIGPRRRRRRAIVDRRPVHVRASY